MRTSGASLTVVAVWLTLVVGVLTNLVTGDFLWLLPLWLVLSVALTFVELRRTGSARLPAGADPNAKERADALRRVRAWVDASLADALGAVDPLPLTIVGADSLFAAHASNRSLLVLGAVGSGKSTELLRLADVLTARAEADGSEPLPVVLSLAGWGRQERGSRLADLVGAIRRRPRDEEPEALLDWLLARAEARYDIPPGVTATWLFSGAVVLLLDGLDEVRPELGARCVRELNEILGHVNRPRMVVACRTSGYDAMPVKPRVRGTVTVAPLSEEQVSGYLGVPLDAELREVVDAPLWLRLTKAVSSRHDIAANPGELRRYLLDAYVTELLDRRGGERVRLLRGLGLLGRLTTRTADPDRVDPRALTGQDAPVAPELGAALRSWVVPFAMAGMLVTGIVLPLVLLFGIEVGVAGAVFACLAVLVEGWLWDSLPYAVDPVSGRPLRWLSGALAGLVLGVVVGGMCALASTGMGALPGPGRTIAIAALAGLAVAVSGDRPSAGAGVATAVAVGCGLWWMELTAPDFQRVLLIVVIGLSACMALTPAAFLSDAGKIAKATTWRTRVRSLVVLAVLAAGLIAVARMAGAPAGGPLDAAIGGLVAAVPGNAAAVVLGGLLAAVLTPFMHRAGLVWTGLLPTRLRPFLRDVARRGLVTETDGGFRFMHGLLRDHVARIDVLDGRPVLTARAAGERETALSRLGTLLAARHRPEPWLAPRLRVSGEEPLTGTDVAARAYDAAGGRMTVLGQIGSGTSTLLLDLAEALLDRARADPRQPVPVQLDLATLPDRIEPVDGVVRPFTRWLVTQARDRYGITTETMLGWLADGRVVLLLDGHGQGRHPVRDAGMVTEFLDVYDIPAVVAGWDDGTPLSRRAKVVTVEPLTRDEVETALAGHPAVVAFLGDDRKAWAALDTVDRLRLVVEAAAGADTGKSYVDGRFAGLPARARLWYAALVGRTSESTLAAVRAGVLMPALMVAVTLAFGLGPAAGIVAGLTTGALARPPLVRLVGRVIGLAAAIALGFLFAGVDRAFSDGAPAFMDFPLPMTDAAFGLGIVIAFSLGLVWEMPVERRVLGLEVLPVVLAVALYLIFDGPATIGPPWPALVGVGMGAFVGMFLFGVAAFAGALFIPLVGLWTGVRPWRRGRFVRALIARRLLVRSGDGLRAADPLVERALPEGLPTRNAG